VDCRADKNPKLEEVHADFRGRIHMAEETNVTREIVLNSPSPFDITAEEIEEIATTIRGLNLNCEVRTSVTQREGVGITWFEILRIALMGGAFGAGKLFTEEVVKKIADVAVDWARERFKGRKKESKRPVYVAIYGPDGVVKSVVIKNATDEPEDRTEEDKSLAKMLKDKK
jgi:hypothetical protein